MNPIDKALEEFIETMNFKFKSESSGLIETIPEDRVKQIVKNWESFRMSKIAQKPRRKRKP